MDKRRLGNTGEMLSIIGFGGILVMNETPAEASRLVRDAVEERGINYFDVAPSYGNAEERLGPALEPFRKSVFLACKTGQRSAEGATAELHKSLQQLRTDHLDLYQMHAVTTMADVDQIMGPGGALEAFVKAREQGKTRYLGFSAHSEEAALALMDRFDFDTVLFPINWAAWTKGNFGPRVVQRAQQKGMGILALKALAHRLLDEGEQRHWPKAWYYPVETYEEAARGIRFTLSKGVTAALTPGHEQLFRWACDAAEALAPLSAADEAESVARSGSLRPVFSR